MDLTQGTPEDKNARAKKMMLWFGIVSMIMSFAGWTSAYIVSRSRDDWASDVDLPQAFFYSTIVIILSSISYFLAKKSVKEGQGDRSKLWLWITLGLGIVFIVLQFQGFSQLVANGYYFTGPTSSIKMSFVFLIAMVHILHLVAGIISLLVVIYNHSKGRYTSTNYLGLSLGATFWHFLDFLWLYLVLFMTFVK
ncbi:cytochrome c oxidase subunit 3 [Maribacter confluentis]|uniref:Cytochrome c oxidase subunit 3 n=2 Tax=Maribacter TaxID=252356 RepID=A0ABY1SDI8_9FLAO|nr:MULTISPECIES: cytochrome c oxidase subunit 3 [Maribacter]MDO1513490.1 cytochrome c oxidase subunit 3 [Maribacter confluentis]TVZ16737.1 cytochrome c oxidase subunit 3 [Maribacter sp. MAR_2009_72]SNR28860.1 cytochrome c oxidase subunit 3 [Maribacter sedimenticola]